MSYHAFHRVPREESTFFKIPPDFPVLVAGTPVQDLDIEARVRRALLAEYETNSSWKPKAPTSESYWASWRGRMPRVDGWWRSLRYYFAVVLSHAAAFSLGSILAARE